MLKTLTLTTALGLGLMVSTGAQAAGAETYVEDFDFSFEGMFGRYDTMQLQRGMQVYTEVCASCHGLEYVTFRSLAEDGGIGWTDDNVRDYIEFNGIELFDNTLDDGFGDFRPAELTDTFPGSQAEGAPDLSLMAKARAGFHGPEGTGLNQLFYGMGGPEYIASLMTGYAEEPECALEGEPMDGYYNTAFGAGGFPESCIDENGKHKVPGSWIGMPPPLDDGWIEYADGSPNDLDALSADVAAFLMWTAEPGLNARKQAGLTGVIFLSVLAVLLYLTNKRLWAPIKKGRDE